MTIITPEWVKDAIFYQIFPDRFARSARLPKRGLKLEAWDAPPTPYGFKAGDLLGVIEHLDHLHDLGVNAVYFNPIFASAANHRYHTYDYYNVDPILGGNAALGELLAVAHERQIKIVLDGVFNHASRGLWQFHHVLENGDGSPYVDWFHFDPQRLNGNRHWGAYPGTGALRALQSGEGSLKALGYQAWWDMPALPKFNTRTPAVREFLFAVAEHWIKFGIDGWRLDVAGEINDDSFWQEFRHRVKALNPEAYIVGEIWDEAQRWLHGDQFDAVMNYMVTIASLGFFTGGHLNQQEANRAGGYRNKVRPLNANEFADRIDYVFHLYDPAITQVQLNLLDSHDTPRFLTCANGDVESFKLAMLFMFTYPGAPCIYYGDEIGLDGGHDPDCRKSFPWEKAHWNLDLLSYTKDCIALRKTHSALRRGSYHRLYSADGVYIFGRKLDEEKLVIALNTADQGRTIDLDVNCLALPDGGLNSLFGESKAKVQGGRIAGLQLAPRKAVVLIR